MIKYSITFSSNHAGNEKSEQEVKELVTQSLKAAGIDGGTLIKNACGFWMGQSEDSYTLSILSESDIAIKVKGLALNLKVVLKQQSVMLEQCVTDTRFI